MRFNNKNVILPAPIIDYLCFEALEAGTVKFEAPNGEKPAWTVNIEYSFDRDNWTTLYIDEEVALQANDKIYFRGLNPNGISYGSGPSESETPYYYIRFSLTRKYNVSGNIMTLIDKVGKTTIIPNNYCFSNLFANSKAVDARNLKLPALTLTTRCYGNLFNGCSELLYAPKELPATSLTKICYGNMFLNNIKLKESPILPATTLVQDCYNSMFYGCTALKKITCYATSGINTNNSTNNWVNRVPTGSTGNFYKNPNANWPTGVNGIPSGWTVHTSL